MCVLWVRKDCEVIMKKMPVAYQLYSAREEAEKDLMKVLVALKEMGYDGVEFAGFYGHSAEDIASMLIEVGLTPISSHVPFATLQEDIFGVISYHQKIGIPYIAVPYLTEEDRPGSAKFAKTIRDIHTFGVLCKHAGIQLLYHNHDFEFETVSGQYGLDFLYDAISDNLLQTELDLCWVKYAGVDPASYLAKYEGRSPIVHLKDFVGTKGTASPYALIGDEKSAENVDTTAFEYRPFGYGCQDAEAIINAAIKAGAQWFVIEQDESPSRPPLESAKMSIDTLYKLGVK